MKKIILTLVVITSITLFSCTKDDVVKQTDNENLKEAITTGPSVLYYADLEADYIEGGFILTAPEPNFVPFFTGCDVFIWVKGDKRSECYRFPTPEDADDAAGEACPYQATTTVVTDPATGEKTTSTDCLNPGNECTLVPNPNGGSPTFILVCCE